MNPLQTRPRNALVLLAASGLIAAQIACSTASPPVPVPVPVPALSAAPPSQPPITSAAPAAPPSAPPPSLLTLDDAGAPAPPATHPYVVAAIGDSLTDPRSHGGGYLAYVKAHCGAKGVAFQLDNFGKGATMVNQMRRSFQQQVAESPTHYTHIVVFGGVNDLYSDLTAFRTPAKIEADLSTMYGWGKQHGVKVVALTVAPWGGFKRYFNPSRAEATHAVNAWLREQPALGVVDTVVDAYALLSCGDPDVLCDRFFVPFKDGIHFGPEGHQLLGQALLHAAFPDCE